MSHRVVQGLMWAVPAERPEGMPKGRPRGAKAAGLRYERALAEALPRAKHGQWWEYRDSRGRGFCQTDLVFELGSALVVLEAKYTWLPEAHGQISQLYKPVVERAMQRQVLGVVVCKVLTPETPPRSVFDDLGSACAAALAGRPAVLHWLGAGLGPLRTALPPAHLVPPLAAA